MLTIDHVNKASVPGEPFQRHRPHKKAIGDQTDQNHRKRDHCDPKFAQNCCADQGEACQREYNWENDWEVDCLWMHLNGGKSEIFVLIIRKTRFSPLFVLPSQIPTTTNKLQFFLLAPSSLSIRQNFFRSNFSLRNKTRNEKQYSFFRLSFSNLYCGPWLPLIPN